MNKHTWKKMKTVFRIIIFGWLVLTIGGATAAAVAAFSQQIKPLPLPVVILSIKLTDGGSGFGFDKEIEIVFRKDGAATFRGGRNSGIRKGLFRGVLARNKFEKLVKLIVAHGFFELKNRYEGNISDMGTKTITVVYEGGEKTVVNWGGSKLREFAVIKNAIREIDAQINWQTDLETKKAQ